MGISGDRVGDQGIPSTRYSLFTRSHDSASLHPRGVDDSLSKALAVDESSALRDRVFRPGVWPE